MKTRLASRLNGVSESAILKLNAEVQAMKARGESVINLTAGEPDSPPPDFAKKAVVAALEKNEAKYTPVPGVPELRKLAAAKANQDQPTIAKQTPWALENIVVSNGAKQALFHSLLALVDEGEVVVVPSPYWVSYTEMVKLAQGKPLIVATKFEDGFKLKASDLKAALQKETRTVKAILINSPSNPTGAMLNAEELKAIGEVIREESNKRGEPIWVISDEIYDRIVYPGHKFVSFLEAFSEWKPYTITVNGLSKSGSMTGWRVGWTVADKNLTQALVTIQGQSSSGINVLAQRAAQATLEANPQYFDPILETYKRRRDIVFQILGKSAKIKVKAPDGAFYFFVGISAALAPGEDSVNFAEGLLKEKKVAVVPGTPFGAPEFVRLSFATSDDALKEGCTKLVEFVERG